MGLARSRAFVDGNMRAAFLAVGLFLVLNGWHLRCTLVEATFTMLAAAGDVSEDDFAKWLRAHAARRMP